MRKIYCVLAACSALTFAGDAAAERGVDGHLNLFYYQAPSLMNPYLSSGNKEMEAATIVIEPLVRFDTSGKMMPVLVEEIPTLENGGFSADKTTLTYKLKPGLKWSDGTDFTAADVVFTARYCMEPSGGCAQLARFVGVKDVEAVDPLTVKITFDGPKPYPYLPFTSQESPIIQAAQFADCLGAKAPSCTKQNFYPVGTGPFKVDDFRPNDVISLSANDLYRDPSKPSFKSVKLKGGGDPASAARSVLETGEYDYAWNIQMAPDVLERMKAGGKGDVSVAFGTLFEQIVLNRADPSPSLPPAQRSSPDKPHPLLSDVAVRKALSMAIDRPLLAEIGYGDTGKPLCNIVAGPEAFVDSENTECLTQDIEGAKALLEQAGWLPGADGIRVKDGAKLSLLFQSSTNAVRQDFQTIIKQWWREIGVDAQLKNIDGAIFFGNDPGSPDTLRKFYADVEMYSTNFSGTDPESFLAMFTCNKSPKESSGWQGENVPRYCDKAYDELIVKLGRTAEIAERAAISRQLNRMLTRDSMTILPLIHRGTVSAHAKNLEGADANPWDAQLWNIADWHRSKN